MGCAEPKDRMAVVEKASGIVAEIGFGSGYNLPYYKNVSKLIAVDPSRKLFDLANDRITSVSFPVEYIQASAESIPLPNNSVDSVISTWSLCSIPHPEAALGEIVRILKPDGTFYFIEHGNSPNRIVAFFQTLFTPFTKTMAGGCHLNRHIEDLIKKLFQSVTVEKSTPKGRPLAFTYKGVVQK